MSGLLQKKRRQPQRNTESGVSKNHINRIKEGLTSDLEN